MIQDSIMLFRFYFDYLHSCLNGIRYAGNVVCHIVKAFRYAGGTILVSHTPFSEK